MLLPCCPSPAQVAATYCVPWNPSDPLIDLYNQAAVQFNSDNDASLAAIIVISLQNRMTLYRKRSCTDCAEGQSIPANLSGAGNTYIEEQQGLQGLNSGLSAAKTAATDALGATSSLAKGITSAIPIVGAITGIISSIVGVFGQAHAQAVAKEQAVNCAAAQQFNTYMPVLDKAVASGQVDAQTGIQTAQQIIDTISANLQGVVSAHNWGWGAQQVLKAQLWFRQQWYPMIAPESALFSPSAAGSVAPLGGSGGILIALALGGLLLFSMGGKQ